MDIDRHRGDPITTDILDAIHIIWKDTNVQEAFARQKEFMIHDNANLYIF